MHSGHGHDHDEHGRDHLHGDDHSRGHSHGHGHDDGHDHRHSGVIGTVRHLLLPHSHDSADRIDDAMTNDRVGIRAVQISLVVLGVTAVLQLLIVLVSGSIALAADTVHNFSDALTAIPLWIAFALGSRSATKRFTYGFGRVEDLAGLFVLAMITISAVVAFVEAVRRLINPVELHHLGWVALAGVVGFIGNEVVAIYRIRVGRRIGSAALIADGLHARTDGLTSLAVVVGALGVWMGFPLADPIVGLVISVAIFGVLWTAAREVFRRLLDGVDPSIVDDAERVLDGAGLGRVHSLKMRWVGHRLYADVELDVDAKLTLAQAHSIAHDAQAVLVEKVPHLTSALVHAYPAH
ncbi:cation diffusion facilitator family transporter [Gordonia asplenii]|uniref:cation diffusion facilitator family transporter n=1 Tax=Gordonia asplenii TaxID=2725283 RepID=UPI001B7D5B0C|nr:cation diffusion facilitator family transporter [Gordonia asplenii]